MLLQSHHPIQSRPPLPPRQLQTSILTQDMHVMKQILDMIIIGLSPRSLTVTHGLQLLVKKSLFLPSHRHVCQLIS